MLNPELVTPALLLVVVLVMAIATLVLSWLFPKIEKLD